MMNMSLIIIMHFIGNMIFVSNTFINCIYSLEFIVLSFFYTIVSYNN